MTDLLDACADDTERIEFLRGRVLLLEHGMVEKDRLIDRAIITLREHGLHADADDIERLAAPF